MISEMAKIADDLDNFVHDLREEGSSDATALWLEKRASALRTLASQEKKPVAWAERYLEEGSEVPCTTFYWDKPERTGATVEIIPLYTAPQIPQPAAGWDDAIEECQKIAEKWLESDMGGEVYAAREIVDAIEALRSKPPSGAGVAVKPLEWVERNGVTGTFEASTSIGRYIATITDDDRGMWFIVGLTQSNYMIANIGAVQRAAQADYERRIRYALSHQPLAGDSNASAEARLREHKWFDPECHEKGCQSLVWRGFYETVVKGRADFREAFRKQRAQAKRLRNHLGIVLSALRMHEEATGESFNDEGSDISQIEREYNSAHTNASDCARDEPADRTADVTFAELSRWLLDNLSLDADHEEDARALLDAFTVGRR